MTDPAKLSPATLCAQLGHFSDPVSGDVVPPIRPATTYVRDQAYRLVGPEYGRDQNPTLIEAERVIAALEGGAEAALFASGMAAGAAVLSLVKPGERIALPALGYHALLRHMAAHGAHYGIGIDRYDVRQPGSLAAAVGPDTRLIWVETPSNPLWQLCDLAEASGLARSVGALLAVDNTAMTPILQQPLAHGADIVMHSATKALNGHSDVLAGVLVARDGLAAWDAIKGYRARGGAMLGAFEAWLLARGLRTLPLRVERASASALKIAEAMHAHPAVTQVRYPGLPEDPGHSLQRAQGRPDRGFGPLLSLQIAGGAEAALQVARSVRLFLRATSIGGVESLIEHRATIEGPDGPTPPDLLRLSIGIEDPEDLIADLIQALDGVVSG